MSIKPIIPARRGHSAWLGVALAATCFARSVSDKSRLMSSAIEEPYA